MSQASDVLYRYVADPARGEFLQGVPARDVTLADWDLLEDQAKADLQSQGQRNDGLYQKVGNVADLRKAAKPPVKRGRGKKGEQLDPDSKVTGGVGRVNADVLASGQPTPSSDEPQQSGVAGFVQADTGGSASNLLGAKAPKKEA